MLEVACAAADNPDRRSLRFSTLALGLALVATSACGPCAAVQDELTRHLRAEFGEVGTGGAVDTGLVDHLRYTLGPVAFAYLIAPLGERELLRPTVRQVTLRSQAGAPVVVVSGDYAGRLTGASIAEGASHGEPTAGVVAVLDIDGVVTLHIDAADRRAAVVSTSIRTAVEVTIVFENVRDVPTLALDLSAPRILALGVDELALPTAYAELSNAAIVELVEAMVREALAGAPDRAPIARWPTVDVGVAALPVAASSLTADRDAGTLRLGVVTALRPVGAVDRPSDGQVVDPGLAFGWWVHPDLLRAAIVQLHASGRLPRRFDDEGRAAVDGANVLSVVSSRPEAAGFTFGVRVHCVAAPRCRVESFSLLVSLSDAPSGFAFAGIEPAADGDRGRGVDRALGEQVAALLSTERRVFEGLLSPALLQMPGGAALQPVVSQTTIDEHGLRASGGVSRTAPGALGPPQR